MPTATVGVAGPSGRHPATTTPGQADPSAHPASTPLGKAGPSARHPATAQPTWARCTDCGRPHFYPRPYCPHCLSAAVRTEPVPGTFRVRSFTWVYRPQRPPVGELPVLLIAGEAEGVTIIAEGSGWAGRTCRIGMPARLVVSDDQRGVPVFGPAGQAWPERPDGERTGD